MGIVIKELKDIWLEKDFDVTEKELLENVPRIISEIEDKGQWAWISTKNSVKEQEENWYATPRKD